MRKPIIGITSNIDSINAMSNSSDEFIFVRTNYTHAIIENGGIPIILNSLVGNEDASAIVERLDGILFIGGQDVDPRCYNEDCKITYCESIVGSGTPYNRPLRDKPNYERDCFEISLYNAAKKLKMPVLGICRGYQLINVAEGGSLHQEIPIEGVLHTILPNETIPTHELLIHENSHAHEIFGSTCFLTCSIHHQGIKHIGDGLIATGFAKDGLVEVVESRDPEHFVIGVQGHPERICKQYDEHNSLFAAFIDASKEYDKRRYHEIDAK